MENLIAINKIIISIAVTITISIVLGCAAPALETKGMWYFEKVSHIYTSENIKKLIIIGKNYHYIFETDETLKKILTSDIKNHIHLAPVINNFHVDGHRNINGKIRIKINQNAPETIRNWVETLPDEYKAYGDIELSLIGIRYNKKKSIENVISHKTSRIYSFQIWEESPVSEQITRKLLSPIAIAADGALILLASPLILLCLSDCGGFAMQGGGK